MNITSEMIEQRMAAHRAWVNGYTMQVPEYQTRFEHVADELNVAPDQYESSPDLKAWVERNKDHRYVPEWLLVRWGLRADPDAGRARVSHDLAVNR